MCYRAAVMLLSHWPWLWALEAVIQAVDPIWGSTRCYALYARCVRMVEVLYYFLLLRYRTTPCITFNSIDMYF
jgi:hypothetical protein